MNNDQILIIAFTFVIFLSQQVSVVNIGNRQYSMHYESHCLLKRKGVFRLIYFKPKHFHRYSIFEVIDFFASYIILLNGIIFLILSFFYDIARLGAIISFIFLIISLMMNIGKLLYIDISRFCEEKYMKNKSKDFNEFNGTNAKLFNEIICYSQEVRYHIDYLYSKELKKIDNNLEIEKLDDKYINYYKNYKDIEVIDNKITYKEKNVYRFEINCIFYGNKRQEFPCLNSKMYMPHLVINGNKKYLGVVFESAEITDFDQQGKAIIRTLYDLELYKELVEGSKFTIREGNKIVGDGKIIHKIEKS